MGNANFRRAIALTVFVASNASLGTVDAAPDAAAIADAVRALEADHDRAIAAVYLLQAGGSRAAQQIWNAWPSLSLLAQKRAIGALSRLAEDHDPAIEALLAAARSDDEALRDRAFTTLRRIGHRGLEGLVSLLPDPGVGEQAASILARTKPEFAIIPLLDAMSEFGGADRAGLRNALGIAVQRAEANAGWQLRAWLAKSPDAAAVASAAMGLRSVEAQGAIITSFIEYAAPKSSDFQSKWRLLQSAGAAGRSADVDRWVQEQLESAPEWMLRLAAVDAMAARGRRELARGALSDPYPRVRAEAATALSGDSASLIERATLARRDVWPMVRAEAVSSLRTEGEAIPVVVASVDDSMSSVRAAAIAVLASSPQDDGWDRIQRRLRDRNEWPQVTRAALTYVVAHCRTDAVDSLLQVVMRAAPSNALTEDLNNAARAIEALRALGSSEARSAVELLRSTDGVPSTLKMALEQPLGEDGGCARAGR